MQQLSDLWMALTLRRRLVVVLATVAMFAAVLGIARIATAPRMALLYSGLEGAASGEVVRALEQRGVTYEVRGGAIFVESGDRDALRMTLAAEGLPRNSGQGYELLDALNGFGTTSRMFDAAYWRAKEGELARTIAAAPQVESARVHIAISTGTPFRQDPKPTASVFITGANGAVTPANAKAFRYLVASAVAGLAPEDVTVVDSRGELIGAPEEETSPAGSDGRAEVLRERVQRLLEARVGPGNAVVEVAVDTNTDSESIRERRIDPQERVAISTETEEQTSTSRNAGNGGDVTVASNLPDGPAAKGNESSAQDSETRERVNFEVSEIERELVRAPGAVRRITVAALVNGIAGTAADGTASLVPRDPAELEEMRALIAAAVGFDSARGDEITIKSMMFRPLEEAGTAAAPGWMDRLDPMQLAQVGLLALVALVLGLFVVRPVLAGGAPALTALPGPDTEAAGTVLTGEVDEGPFDLPDLPDLPLASGFDSALPVFGGDTADPVARLRDLIGERQEETVEILRSWLADGKEAV